MISIVVFQCVFLLVAMAMLLVWATAVSRKIDDIQQTVGVIEGYSVLTRNAYFELKRMLDDGVKLRNDSVTVEFCMYWASLYFDGAEIATKIIRTLETIGYDDEIEILPGDDDSELTVVFDRDCFVRHPLGGLTELHIPVNSSTKPFRDRLLSDGWKITSPETDSGGTDDAVLPDQVEVVDTGK